MSELIGRNTARFFRDNNLVVRGVSRGFDEYRTASATVADLAGIELLFGDIADTSFAEKVLQDVQQIVCAAGASGVAATWPTLLGAVTGPWNHGRRWSNRPCPARAS